MQASHVTAPPPGPATEWLRTDEEGWPLLPPTLLTIVRTSTRDERSRQIVCRLNGAHVAELLYGQECTMEIPPGRHELKVHNTLMWRTLAFTAAPGSHVRFTVVNRAPMGFYALLFLIGVAPLILEVERGF